jgi:hypothetical protein
MFDFAKDVLSPKRREQEKHSSSDGSFSSFAGGGSSI